MVRGEGIRPGQSSQQMPGVVLTFYDENRATVGQSAIGDWRGTFGWQRESKRIDVPARAREAVMRIGLLGGVGSISFDAIEVKAVGK